MVDTPEKPTALFDPDDPSVVKYTKGHVWDWYEDISLSRSGSTKVFRFRFPGSTRWRKLREAFKSLPHITRLIKDIISMEDCLPLFMLHITVNFLGSLIPAISLWYSGQFLRMIEAAGEKMVDKGSLGRIVIGHFAAPVLQGVLKDANTALRKKMGGRIAREYHMQSFRTISRLDVPTFSGTDFTRRQSESRLDQITFGVFRIVLALVTGALNVIAQLAVLYSVFQSHREANFLSLLVVLRFAQLFQSGGHPLPSGVHARKVHNKNHLSEAGGMRELFWQVYRSHSLEVGDATDDYTGPVIKPNWYTKLSDYVQDPIKALAQVYTCFLVFNSPSLAPLSLASFQLVNTTTLSLSTALCQLGEALDDTSRQLDQLGQFFGFLDMSNKIKDGHTPFPENLADLRQGISVEFRKVSFSYTKDGKKFALRNVSFKVEQGQLCVIVGENGSGKSTILSLITRIHDVTDGQILLNEVDLRTMKLDDVRKSIAVLFQEYSIFPLTLRENIGYGDPDNAEDMDMIQQAADLAGATDFIEALPYGFSTYVIRPVRDFMMETPTHGSIFEGKTVDFSKLKLNDDVSDFSGGQKQRIALSRTLAKSMVSPNRDNVGLLLFDEPSASLDPRAEHQLFTRLRELRGTKTLMFSTHRFGKLTRHADLILYMSQGEVLEAGSHVDLLERGGEYAKFWNLQAEDFL